ncbi:MAG: VirB4-like conjugal transfer ATPase, CD1110 family [Suipraeoptans sp.]
MFGVKERFKLCKKGTDPIYKTPNSIQQTIPIYAISENGVFQIEKPIRKDTDVTFDKVYTFSDVNYTDKDHKEKEEHFLAFCKLLNSMNVNFKIIIANHNLNKKEFDSSVMMKDKAGYETLVTSYNEAIEHQIKEGKNTIQQERYFVVTCKRKDFANANAFFQTIEASVKTNFTELGSRITILNAVERLKVLHKFYRLGKETEFNLTMEDLRSKREWKNDICNLYIKEELEYLQFEDRLVTTMFVKAYPNSLPDSFLTELTNVPFNTITTLDISPIPKDIVESKLMDAYMDNERQINKQQEFRNKHGAFSSEITYEKRKEKEEIEEYLDEVHSNDARMFFVGMTILVTGIDRQDLDSKIDTIKTIGSGVNMQIETYCGRQVSAMNTSLPIGCREVEIMRSMFTQPLAVLMPFNVQELYQENGQVYGVNQISRNVLVGNRKELSNGNGFIYGLSGSGKSVQAKWEMGQVLASTDDDVISLDPMNEYFEICSNLGGQNINLTSRTTDYINPLEINIDNDDKDSLDFLIRDKSEFMLGICQKAIEPEEITGRHRSVIDRCVSNIYHKAYNIDSENFVSPTFEDFRNELLIDHDINNSGQYVVRTDDFRDIARDLALSMEIFIDGSLNIFSHQSNVDIDNRFINYGISDLGAELRAVSMLIMIENVINRIKKNAKRGVATWVYLDEFHVITNDPYGHKAFEKLWKEVRKQGGLLTGITQNVADCLGNKETRNMLSNSEFIIFMNQAGVDRELLGSVVPMSIAQEGYVTNAEIGTGLMKFGSSLIPFDNVIPENNDLYRLFDTNFHDKDNSKGEQKAG